MEFYIKNEQGEFEQANSLVDKIKEDYLREKSAAIVSEKISKYRDKEAAKLREELEPKIREELAGDLRKELTTSITAELEKQYADKLQAEKGRADELDVRLRQKTIAAEYGFKPEAEQFLGTGSDEEMRARADALKEGITVASQPHFPEKEQASEESNGFVRLTGEAD